MISYHTDDFKMPCFPKRKISTWIKQTAAQYQCKTGDISYVFCSDKKIRELNNEYLSHDYFTDIITFDYTENGLIAGDIFISVDTVHSNAIKYGVPFGNELYRVIIHGILHLCGKKDKTTAARKAMNQCENEALHRLYNEILTVIT